MLIAHADADTKCLFLFFVFSVKRKRLKYSNYILSKTVSWTSHSLARQLSLVANKKEEILANLRATQP